MPKIQVGVRYITRRLPTAYVVQAVQSGRFSWAGNSDWRTLVAADCESKGTTILPAHTSS